MVESGKKLPLYDDCGTCTNYSSIMAVTIMMVSLAVRMFENLELLVNLNLSWLGKAGGTYFSGGLNLDIDFLYWDWLQIITSLVVKIMSSITGNLQGVHTIATLMIYRIDLNIVEN